MNAYSEIAVDPAVAAADDIAPIIAFEGVSKTYAARGKAGEVSALSDINLAVPKGEIVGVIGRSGAGKSTLIRLINALEVPSSGVVRVRGTDIASLSEKDLREARRSIGMIFQHFNLLSSRTAFDNIALPLEIAGTPKRDIAGIVEPLLEMVGLADKRDRYPAELSGGQKQRVGIARALVTKPDVLLSDEATSALDPETTDQILELLKRINAELNVTIAFITHEMDVVKKLADRVAVIDGGAIVEQGTAYDVFTHPQHPTTKSFVSTVTGTALPDHLARDLHPDYASGRSALLHLTFVGQHASDPVLTTVARKLNIDIGIVAGQIETISGHPFGTLFVAVRAAPEQVDVVIAELSGNNTRVEHLGYVA